MRTWDDNRRAINELWPLMEFSSEAKKLWTDDLSGLDQVVLYDAIRNVRRNTESNYPQLKWIRDEYRGLRRLSTFGTTPSQSGEPRQVVKIDPDADSQMREELRAYIDGATPSEFRSTVDLIAEKASKLQIEMATAFRLVRYLTERLGLADGGDMKGAT